jgi:DNA-directed RNA polymerase subunit RPC12/RpoP
MRYPCPTCRQVLESPDAAGGMKVSCPHCGQKIMLPAARKPAADNRTRLAEVGPAGAGTVPPSAVVPSPAPPAPAAPAGGAAGPRPWWRTPQGLIPLAAAGAGAAVLLVVLLVVVRGPRTYTVADLANQYHSGMRGEVVRVSGPILNVEPSRREPGLFILLHAPGQRLQVGSFGVLDPGRHLRYEENVTLVGEVYDRVTLRADGVSVVLLRNARVER